MTRRASQYLAQDNAAKIGQLLAAQDDRTPAVELHRTIEAGPSGQRADQVVGLVRYSWRDPHEVEIVDPSNGSRAGYAHRDRDGRGGWAIFDDTVHDGVRYIGRASSLSVGCDVLLNGQHAALGRHDHRRISSGNFHPFTPAVER